MANNPSLNIPTARSSSSDFEQFENDYVDFSGLDLDLY